MTSPMTDWTLGGLEWTLEKYAPELTNTITCFWEPREVRPSAHRFQVRNSFFIGDFEDYPRNRWSDGFIKVCEMLVKAGTPHFLFMMDDFWLVRRADIAGIEVLYEGMKRNGRVVKIDLATDRLYAHGGERYLYGANTVAYEGHLDIIASDPRSEYHMSLWGGLFNAQLLLDYVLIPGESAQDIEMLGTGRLAQHRDVHVLGTRQCPLRHSNVVQGGRVEYRGYRLNHDWVNSVVKTDLEEMIEAGVELR